MVTTKRVPSGAQHLRCWMNLSLKNGISHERFVAGPSKTNGPYRENTNCDDARKSTPQVLINAEIVQVESVAKAGQAHVRFAD